MKSPSRTQAEFSPFRDYDQFGDSAAKTVHKDSSSSIKKLRPPLPKIKNAPANPTDN